MIILLSTALFAYEYMVAFDREVDLFWKRKLTIATVLFIANRYVPLHLYQLTQII